jgi:hypothetical protein
VRTGRTDGVRTGRTDGVRTGRTDGVRTGRPDDLRPGLAMVWGLTLDSRRGAIARADQGGHGAGELLF